MMNDELPFRQCHVVCGLFCHEEFRSNKKVELVEELVMSFFSTSRRTSINHSKYLRDGQIQRK